MKFLCTKCGKGVAQVQASHTCKASDMKIVTGMVENLPQELKGKLALALLREVQGGQGHMQAQGGHSSDKVVVLPQPCGGNPTTVHIGTSSTSTPSPGPFFTHADVQATGILKSRTFSQKN